MKTNDLRRRDFIKYGLISSALILTGCSTSKNKLALRGVANSFPNEFINSLSTPWEFLPIKDIELNFKQINLNLKGLLAKTQRTAEYREQVRLYSPEDLQGKKS